MQTRLVPRLTYVELLTRPYPETVPTRTDVQELPQHSGTIIGIDSWLYRVTVDVTRTVVAHQPDRDVMRRLTGWYYGAASHRVMFALLIDHPANRNPVVAREIHENDRYVENGGDYDIPSWEPFTYASQHF